MPTYPDMPTGVGFCLYVRRALLDAIGTFDLAFGAGYGEENDFCLRAAAPAVATCWPTTRSSCIPAAARSKDARPSSRERNMPLLLERHPDYLDMVRGYIAADPLRPLRERREARLAARAPGCAACCTSSMTTAAAPRRTCAR